MKRSMRMGHVAFVVSAARFATAGYACPNCNIHNHLAASVQSSTNIFHGKVLQQIDEWTVEVEVLKVLRGEHKVDSRVKSKIYGAKRYIGKEFIFSDPASWPPVFDALPLEFEDQALFLRRASPATQ